MGVTSIAQVKDDFKNGDLPDQVAFVDFIDTVANPQIGFEQDSSIALDGKLVQFIMTNAPATTQVVFGYSDILFNATYDSNNTDTDLGVKTAIAINSSTSYLQFVDKATSNSVLLSAGADGVQVRDDVRDRGVTGTQDFSPNIQSLDYAQKSYVDFGNLIDLPFNAALNIDVNTGQFFGVTATGNYVLTFSNVPQDVAPKRAGLGILTVEVGALHTLTLGANVVNIGGISVADIQQTLGAVYCVTYYTQKGVTFITILNEQ